VRQQQFKYTYLFGAVCPQRGVSMGLLLPYANSDTMRIHLEHIEEIIPEGKYAVIVLDQAGWHTTKKLGVFQKLSLLPLPAYSPELNPCEQIWKQLRRTHLSNRCFKNDEDLENACCDAWNDFSSSTKTVESLCSRDWAKL
jgi:transposase